MLSFFVYPTYEGPYALRDQQRRHDFDSLPHVTRHPWGACEHVRVVLKVLSRSFLKEEPWVMYLLEARS